MSNEVFALSSDLAGLINPRSVEETLASVASEPVDWVQVKLWSQLKPEDRVKSAMNAMLFARAALQSTLVQKFPHKSPSEINMQVLEHFSPVRQSGDV